MNEVKLGPWDAAEHLRSEEDIDAYYGAALEEGPDFMERANQVIAEARRRIAQKLAEARAKS